MKPAIALAALIALAPHAAAERMDAPDPADPSARVPAAKYESVFTGYRGYREEPLAPWRGVNDDVARAGGHIGILRGAGHLAPGSDTATTRPSVPSGKGAPGSSPAATGK